MAERFIFDKLSILNQVYQNSLEIDGEEKESVYPLIKTTLYPHQRRMVEAMNHHRERFTRGFLCEKQAINGKIGIVGDLPGTGKTLSVLAYLATYSKQYPKTSCELTPHSSKYFFSHDISSLSEQICSNLVIVPHYLYHQWIHDIQTHTRLTYCGIETKRLLKGQEFANSMIESDVVITTNKCYQSVQQFASEHTITWNNIFIDEASSIYLKSSDPPLSFQFLWLITNNWIPLLFKTSSLSKIDLYHLRDQVHMHEDLKEWLLDNRIPYVESHLISSHYFKDYLPFMHKKKYYLVLRNSNQTIQNSMKLPALYMEEWKCRPNISLQSLGAYFASRNRPSTIEKGMIPYLLQVLNIDCKGVNQYVEHQPNLVHNIIRRKTMENECTICLEKAEYPIITNCCNNICCAHCLLTNMMMNRKCPTCREVLGTNKMCCLHVQPTESIIKQKTEQCLEILQNNKNGRFIIYSSFDNIYYQLFEQIDKIGMKAERIENNLFSMLRTLKNYTEGKTHILFISNVDMIRGLSIHSTTHLIFYHEPSSYESKQILIHSAQRLGRQTPLSLLHLNSEIQL
jgi:hypothetical protein